MRSKMAAWLCIENPLCATLSGFLYGGIANVAGAAKGNEVPLRSPSGLMLQSCPPLGSALGSAAPSPSGRLRTLCSTPSASAPGGTRPAS